MHGIEELAGPPYLFRGKVRYRVRGHAPLFSRNHDFRGVEQRYERLGPALLRAKAMRRGRLLKAEALLVEAAPMWELGLKALRRNPYAFVKREP